jgi:predicted nucleic acid-binding protein
MTTHESYYYDSYAVIEFINGNERYKPFFGGSISGALTKHNLAEIYYWLRKHHAVEPEQAANVTERFSRFLVDYEIVDLCRAMELRIELGAKKLSYADALGYHLAKKMKIPFLTGDIAFKELDGVKFVK